MVTEDTSQSRRGVLKYTIMATDTGQFALSDLTLQIGTETVSVPPVSVVDPLCGAGHGAGSEADQALP